MPNPIPTDRELSILQVLWDRGEATVRQVYEALRDDIPIVQNTAQAFLRTMAEKGLVTFRTEGRSFVYQAAIEPDVTRRGLLGRVLDRAYDGAIDQLVEGAVGIAKPTREERNRIRALLDRLEAEENQP